MNFYDRQFYFLIILTKLPKQYSYMVMSRIFSLCYELDVINANIIADYPSLGVCMFTYFLDNWYKCRTLRPRLYFRFSQGFENLKTVFPPKFTNFYGCPMKVAARIMPPMLAFRGNTSNPKSVGRWENLSGFEGMLLKSIAASLNFTIQLLPFSDRQVYPGLVTFKLKEIYLV